MKPAILAVAAALALHAWPAASAEPEPIGAVALADWPMCDVFVVVAGSSFSLMTWRSGLWAWSEGDAVRGAVEGTGRRTMTIVPPADFGEIGGEMSVEVLHEGLDLRQAQASWYRACKVE